MVMFNSPQGIIDNVNAKIIPKSFPYQLELREIRTFRFSNPLSEYGTIRDKTYIIDANDETSKLGIWGAIGTLRLKSQVFEESPEDFRDTLEFAINNYYIGDDETRLQLPGNRVKIVITGSEPHYEPKADDIQRKDWYKGGLIIPHPFWRKAITPSPTFPNEIFYQ